MSNIYPNSITNSHNFSQYIRTDIGICFGLESVNLHSTENISFYPKLPNLINFYETKDDSNQCNHILFNNSEFSNRFYQNYLNNRNNIVEYYRQDSQHLNYSFDTIYEQHLTTNVSVTNNSTWNNFNEAVSPKKKWMRHYMMSKNILLSI